MLIKLGFWTPVLFFLTLKSGFPETSSQLTPSSSEESANFHSLEPEALTDPARQALRSTRLVDLFIALCTASDECNP